LFWIVWIFIKKFNFCSKAFSHDKSGIYTFLSHPCKMKINETLNHRLQVMNCFWLPFSCILNDTFKSTVYFSGKSKEYSFPQIQFLALCLKLTRNFFYSIID